MGAGGVRAWKQGSGELQFAKLYQQMPKNSFKKYPKLQKTYIQNTEKWPLQEASFF